MAAANASAAWSGAGRPIEGKQVAHHVLHLVLLGRAAPPPRRALSGAGVYSPHGKAALGAGHERRPAGLARGEGGRARSAPNQTVSIADARPDGSARPPRPIWWWIFMQTLGQRQRRRRGHAPVGHARQMRPALLDDPPTRMGQPGINSHHDAHPASQKISPTF